MSHLFKRVKSQKGITGLETAIILIAFVIVASVLAYVVISAGLFSSQKAKSAVNSGLQQTGSTVELKGNVVVKMDNGEVTEAYLTVGIVPGGTAVDLTDTSAEQNSLLVSYFDATQMEPSLDWTVEFLNYGPLATDNMLDSGELAQLTVTMPEGLGPGATFTIEIKPPDGSVLPIERTIPSRASGLVNLY